MVKVKSNYMLIVSTTNTLTTQIVNTLLLTLSNPF